MGKDENIRDMAIRRFKSHSKKYPYGMNHDNYEMYQPEKSKRFKLNLPKGNFNNFLRKYIYFRVPNYIKQYLMNFLLIFIIGVVLNYVYYQTFSLRYLFIGGINEWYQILMITLNVGAFEAYTLFYLILNGIFYFYFYSSFIMLIYSAITKLDRRETWIMLGWFALIIYTIHYFMPHII